MTRSLATGPTTGAGPRSPYVGPRPFRATEPFFGRDREARSLRNTLLSGRIVLLHSPSGAGKTSLIQAQIVPEFEQRFQICATVAPRFSALRVNLPPPEDLAVPNRYVFSVVNGLVGHVVSQSDAAGMRLTQALDRSAGESHDGKRQLLVIDQLEEILILDPGDTEGQKEFFRQLGEALEDDRRWCLMAIREDYMGGLDRFQRYLPGQLRSTFRLNFLEAPAAKVAIKDPAKLVGVDFADDAVDLVVRELQHVKATAPDVLTADVSWPYIEPVLLQVICDGLWRKLSDRQGTELRVITRTDVERFRPFNKALSAYYRKVVTAASRGDLDTERAVRQWIDHELISRDGLRRPTRSMPEVEDANAVVRTLSERYLIRDDPRPGGSWWELSHDLLVTSIQQDNRTWRKGNLASWQVSADKWYRFGHDSRYLLGPVDLHTATQLSRKTAISDVERSFLDESRKSVSAKGKLASLKRRNLLFGVALASSLCLNIVLVILWRRYRRRGHWPR